MEENFKLYSQRAISITTFFGGPLAAGILIRENYKSLNKNNLGTNALLIGIGATIFILGVLFLLPESIVDKIPNSLIAAIYTGIIYLIVERIQGKELKSHKENGREFESAWKAAGVGALSMVLIIGAVFIAADLTTTEPSYDSSTFDATSYDNGLATFYDQETRALEVFNSTESKSVDILIYNVKNGIVLWKQNKILIEKLNLIKNLPAELQTQNDLLNEYCDLRIEHFGFLLKTLKEDTDMYSNEMNDLMAKINSIIDELS